jgi:2-polyprenyl-3-methyl-5-hydroxy-6-metoxy-1,4-benzoquinol methylase
MKFNKLPFYWRLKARNEPNIVPDFQPFEYTIDETLQLIIQKREPYTLECLEKIYHAESNIGYLQDANIIARPYGVDFMEFIDRSLDKWGDSARQVLEVGCGGCTILKQLKDKGYGVIGVDPSPIAVREGEKKGIRVIQEFFPTPQYTELVDLIFHCDVIEHVSDPVGFLSNQRKQLKEGGLLIVSLPDCNEGIERGEISMTMHQHLNYFDNEGLRNVVECAGFDVLTIETAKYGGSLYVCAMNRKSEPYVKKSGREKLERFETLADANTRKVTSRIRKAFDGGSVGFYVPLRTLPYLSVMNRYTGFRFFDDTHHWYDKAFDGVEVYIENMQDLLKSPVSDLFIMSLTFGEVIKRKLTELNYRGNVSTLREIIDVDK